MLFGDYNPSGKLPLTFPKTVGQIPFNFPFKRGSQVPTDELNAQERKTLVNGALYPFGHGLSYTTYRVLESRDHTDDADPGRGDPGRARRREQRARAPGTRSSSSTSRRR